MVKIRTQNHQEPPRTQPEPNPEPGPNPWEDPDPAFDEDILAAFRSAMLLLGSLLAAWMSYVYAKCFFL